MKYLPLWLLIGLFFNGINAYSQTDTTFLKKAIDSLDKREEINPVEKIYLHLDRSAHDPGDTLWFKAYNLIGIHHRLSALSEVVYVELTGPEDTVLVRRMIQLTAGTGWGDIAVSRNFKPGSYHLRAYTNWMRNADVAYFFDKKIQIGQPEQSNPNKTPEPNPDVQFFPEGGELVNGIRSKVAVKAINANGTGVNINGTVIDNDGNTIAEFTSGHLGMAVFALSPQPGKTYKAKITDTGKTAFTVDLPHAIDKGYTLAVNNSQTDSIMVKVAVNTALFSEKQNSKFYIVAQSAGAVYYTAAGKLEQPVFTSTIAKKRFPSGIVQFTLFSETGEPLSERIAFIRNNDTLKLNVAASATTFTTRQPVKIALDATNNTGKPSIGTFSVAVINESRLGVDETTESTILNNILLTSDLKGYIEKPNYYFINPNEQTNADLDLLMLTQGYRRFEWKQILNTATPPVTYRPEKALELTGTIKTPGGKPIANGKVTIMQMSQGLLKDTTTDAEGNFHFTDVELTDASKVVISALKPNGGKDVAIFIKQNNYPVVIKHQDREIEAISINESLAADTSHQQKIMEKQLGEVMIKAAKTAKPNRFNNYGTREEHFVDMTRLSGYSSLKEALYATLGLTLLPHNIGASIDGRVLRMNDLAAYLPQEVEQVGVIYSIRTGRPSFIEVTTKRNAGTDTTVLKNVTITARKINKGPDLTGSSNLNGPGHADQVLMGDKLSDCINLADCLNGKLFGVMFKNGKPYNSRSIGRSKTSMILIVDGIVQDGSRLSELFANDIYSVEVLRSGAYLAIYGSNASGGALVITTKRGSGQDTYVSSDVPAGTITYPFKGFYKARTFYSPKYKGNGSDKQLMDLRNTIYWNPEITTDKNGQASFEYFNADSKGVYKVIVEGIDADGNPGRKVYRYSVN